MGTEKYESLCALLKVPVIDSHMHQDAGHHLLKQQEKRKLILLVPDGEPADVDERDPQHLRHDTKKAVEELYSKGVLSYCLTLDPNADDYVKRIFGANNYTIIDNVNRLPEKLPTLFASLTA